MSDMASYQVIMRLMDKSPDQASLALLEQRAAYYEKRLGLTS